MGADPSPTDNSDNEEFDSVFEVDDEGHFILSRNLRSTFTGHQRSLI